MSLRSVLMLTYHFPPSAASGSFRMLGFARHLPAYGWRAAVVAPPTLPWEPVDDDLLKRVPPGTAIYPAPYTKNKVVRKLAMFGGWLPDAARVCTAAIRETQPDAILTSGPPHEVHWLGLWLKRRYGIPWLADFRDPWFPYGRNERGKGFAAWKVGVQEAAVMRDADLVIANAPNASKALRDAYPRHRSKFVTLTNGYDRETFDTLSAEFLPARLPGAAVRVVHAGAIYVGRDPRPFLDAVKTLGGDTPTSLDVNFFGPPPESGLDLAREAELRGIGDRVHIHGQVPYACALREMVGADVLLLMDTPGRRVGVPAKLYEYIGAGRPVLALGEENGDLAQVLEQSGIPYRIASPGDSSAIATALAYLSRGSAVGLPARGEPHRFSREAIAGRLAALLDRSTRREDDTVPDRATAGAALVES